MGFQFNTAAITVYLNLSRDAVSRGYVNGDFLEEAWKGIVRLDQGYIINDLCNTVFALCQQGLEGASSTHRGRSMCDGDVIEVIWTGRTYMYACSPEGWKQVKDHVCPACNRGW